PETVPEHVGEAGRSPKMLLEAQALVLEDDKGTVALPAAQRQDVPQRGRAVFPDPGAHAPNVDLVDFEHLPGGGQLPVGLRARPPPGRPPPLIRSRAPSTTPDARAPGRGSTGGSRAGWHRRSGAVPSSARRRPGTTVPARRSDRPAHRRDNPT